jgi:hypothetical protein
VGVVTVVALQQEVYVTMERRQHKTVSSLADPETRSQPPPADIHNVQHDRKQDFL